MLAMTKPPGPATHVATVACDGRGKWHLILTPRKSATGCERLVFALSTAVDSVKAAEMAKTFNWRGSLLAGGLPLAPDEIPVLH